MKAHQFEATIASGVASFGWYETRLPVATKPPGLFAAPGEPICLRLGGRFLSRAGARAGADRRFVIVHVVKRDG